MTPRRRAIIFITAAVGIILLLILFFGRGGSKPKAPEAKPVVLTDYIERDSRMSLTVGGRIIGDDEHRSIRITVGRGSRQMEVIQGYQNNVIQTHRFDNNQAAYDVFVRALAKTGFGRDRKATQPDERGVCPDSQRYIFEVIDNNDVVSRTWTAGCVKGTSPANFTSVQTLFRNQITDYAKLARDVRL